MLCLYCKKEIMKTDRTVCGWTHLDGITRCLLDATPTPEPPSVQHDDYESDQYGTLQCRRCGLRETENRPASCKGETPSALSAKQFYREFIKDKTGLQVEAAMEAFAADLRSKLSTAERENVRLFDGMKEINAQLFAAEAELARVTSALRALRTGGEPK
jgi:phosphoglycolate phosphatase-like HAD superfamily hydrolase